MSAVFSVAIVVLCLVAAAQSIADLRATAPAPDRWWRFHAPTLAARRASGAMGLGGVGLLLCTIAERVIAPGWLPQVGGLLCIACGVYWSQKLKRATPE